MGNRSGFQNVSCTSQRKKTPLRPVVVRVGQLSYALNGHWNGSEWIPLAISTAVAMGMLPTQENPLALLPLSDAATALIEMVNSPYNTLHLVHPRPIPCSLFIRLIANATGKQMQFVTPTEWVAQLKSRIQATEDYDNPAAILIPIFEIYSRRMALPGKDAFGIPMYDASRALQVAPSLSEKQLPPTGKEGIERMVKFWRESGLIQDVAEQIQSQNQALERAKL